MPKISGLGDLGRIGAEKFHESAAPVIKDAVDIINGKLKFDENINSQHVEVIFTVANAEVAVSHDLKRKGLNYLVSRKSVDCSIFDGTTEDTLNIVYLKSTQPATVTVVLY